MADMLPMVGLATKAADKLSPEIGDSALNSPPLGESSATGRRPSLTPSIQARRGVALPQLSPVHLSAMKRPQIQPLQRESDPGSSQRSQRSVRFDTLPSFAGVISPPMSTGNSITHLLEQQPDPSNHPKARLFGRRTRFRPLWLLGFGNAGSCLFGSGAVVLQRAIWPAKDYAGLNLTGPTALPAGTAGHGTAFGGETGGIVGGTVLMALGVGAALTASGHFVRDGRALNRRQNPAKPNYRRTMGYFYAHLFGIGLLVGHRFTLEAFRLYLGPRWQWVATLPGATGQAVFAITQAQSFSSCEVYYGKQPLRHRGAIAATARAGVGFYVLVAAIIGTPNFSAYGREAVRLVAQTSAAVAFSLPLTTARLSQKPAGSPRVEIGEERYRGDWTAIQIYAVYALARMISMLGAYWLEHSRWPADLDPSHSAFAAGGTDRGWRGLPPPLPSGPADYDGVSCAAFLLTGATLLGLYSFYQFRKDAKPPAWRANGLFWLASSCLIMGQTYRTQTEYAKAHADFKMVWQAMPVGLVANAIAFVVIPEMFSRSEITRRNYDFPYRYQVTEASRALGILCFTLWASMSGILNFPPLARMMMNWCGSIFTILGFALPDATTRKAQTGSLGTPQGEPSDWLTAHTLSR